MILAGLDRDRAMVKADHAYDVEQTAKLLDGKYPKWDVCRTMMKQWSVTITNEQRYSEKKCFTGDQLAVCMQQAFEWDFIPIVPDEPTVRNHCNFEIRKNGTKWELFYSRGYCTTFKTRKEAEQAIERWVGLDEKAHAEWESEYAWTRTQREGIDFRWKSNG